MKEFFTKLMSGVKAIGGWLKTIPSEPNGNGSTSRTALLMLTSTICWLLYAYYHYHGSLPDRDTLLGLGALLSAVCGAYGISKWTGGGSGPTA